MRFTFYFILTLLGLTLGSLILAPSLFDINTYKTKIIHVLNKKFKGDLAVRGDIELSFLPSAKITIKKVDFSEKGKPSLFSSEKVVISPSLVSLLKGEIEFKKVKIERALIYIEKNKDKKLNWQSGLEKNNNNEMDISNKDKNNKDIKENPEKKKMVKNNFFGIKELEFKESRIEYSTEEKLININDLNILFKSKGKDKWEIVGDLNLNNKIFKYNYSIKKNDEKLSTNGFISTDNIKIKNTAHLNLSLLEGKGNIDLSLTDINNVFSSNYFSKAPLELLAKYSINSKQLEFKDIKIESLNTQLAGDFIYTFGKRNNINIFLATKSINLEELLNVDKKKEKNSRKNDEKLSTGASEIVKENKSFSFKEKYKNFHNNLEKYNIFVDLQAKEVLYKKLKIKNFKSEFKNNKSVNLKVTSANIFEGNVKGSLIFRKNDNILIDIIGKDINLMQLSENLGYRRFNGSLFIKNKYKLAIKKDIDLYKNLSGTTDLSVKKLKILGFNFLDLKKNIKSINSLKDVKKINDVLISGDTFLGNQNFNFNYQSGNVSIPLTSIKLGEEIFNLHGNINAEKKVLDINLNYKKPKLKILSLFNLNFSGNINNVNTNVKYDQGNLEKALEDVAKTKLKKLIDDKLEKKFDNIMDNLLN